MIYIAGQGAHSRGNDSDKGKQPDIEMHARMVMENVKTLVEAGGGTMDSILQLTVFLIKIDDYDGLNKVFKTYFPNGGPARTCVTVAALPGESLVEINCTAAVVNAEERCISDGLNRKLESQDISRKPRRNRFHLFRQRISLCEDGRRSAS